ncbi:MAG TPA: rod shape-determining protein MreC [Candidatus Olsenella pullistercoris]|uniref:Cell shape-determining protein MreC n=1 Tax=Candidatus Olsenella pullistercoris TaxID=2838712 RepID=A0A9D2EZ01_9ACTN|nr:rod shape-determining protein MreC [Candidatus Olsenella pullistercoris]
MPLSTRRRGAAPTIGSNKGSSGVRALVVCAVLSVALFTLSCQTGETGPLGAVRGAFQTVTTPVRYLGATITAPLQGLGNVFANLTADQETLSELRDENERLRTENAQLTESAQSATRLQELLDLQDTYSLQSSAARIISGSTDSWSSTVTLDKGTSSGLTAGMPVMSAAGVIGQIVSCGPTSSTVRLLSDESSSISCMVQSSRAQGMLTGSASGEVRLTLVSSSQEVAVGDVVVTSGLGGVFPKGLPVGEVTSVESNPGDVYLDIVVELYAHPETSEEVLVITSLTEGQQATAEDIAEADAQERSESQSGADGTEGTDGEQDGEGTDASQTTDEGQE